MSKISCILIGILIPFLSEGQNRFTGITMVAPPKQISVNELNEIKEINADWVALVPYGFSRVGSPDIRYNLERQWWGEKKEGIIESIKLAKKAGLKVMLKPQVYIHNSWVGDVDFKTEEEWIAWENSYREFISFYLDIAIDHNVDIFCIGTEYKIAAKKREKFWRAIIEEAKSNYRGQIIYSSNWDGYENVPFWDDLDYIGISAYFPLTEQSTPTVNTLTRKWRPIKKKLRTFANKYNKQICFTEYGYLTIDKCAWRAWELEKLIHDSNINQEGQANAYAGLFKSFHKEKWWAGGFLWKWFPAGMGHEGYPEKDYTPQNKLSENIIRDWYNQL